MPSACFRIQQFPRLELSPLATDDPHKGRKSLARNFAHLFGARLVTHVGRGLYIIVVARFLGPELYAILAFVHAWYMAFFPLAVFGLMGTLAREVGRRGSESKAIIGQSLSVSIIANISAALLCVLTAWTFNDKPEIVTLLGIMTIALTGRALASFSDHVFTAVEQSQYVLKHEAIFRSIEIALGIAALFLGAGLLGVVAVHALVWWLHAWRGFYVMRKLMGGSIALSTKYHEWQPIALMAVPFLLASVFTNLLLQAPIILFKSASADTIATGNFAIAVQLLLLAVALPQTLSSAALPIMSRAAARGDGKDALFLSVVIRTAFIVGCTGGLVGTTVGPWLIPLVFGPSYTDAGLVLGPLLWCIIPLMIVFTLPPALYAREANKGAVLASAAGVIVLVVTTSTLVGSLELRGGILALASALSVTAALLLYISTRKRLISLTHDALKPGAAAAASAVAYYASQEMVGVSQIPALLIGMTTLAALTVATKVVRPNELSAARRFIRQRFGQ